MEAENSHRVQVANGNAKFAGKFYDILSKDKENVGKNLVFSPLSAHAVLALTYQGACGKTCEDFAKVLCLPDKDVAAKGYNSVINLLNNIKKITLLMANKVFVMKDYPLKETFSKTATELFLSETQLLDFEKSNESAAIINKWVEKKTNSKIKNLVSANCFDESTRLVLVNAVYFKAGWFYPFSKSDTKIEPFYISKDEKVDCNMMHNKKCYRFAENQELDAKILDLFYGNRDISMVVILPNEIDGIADLEKKLTNVDLSTIRESLSLEEVQISLPKFKIESTMELNSILEAMGLGIIFNELDCNLSEISESDEPLAVSQIIQKAFIEVNEEGAEAAAACGTFLRGGGPPVTEVKEYVINVDHPFIILLQSIRDGIILFCGRISNPELK